MFSIERSLDMTIGNHIIRLFVLSTLMVVHFMVSAAQEDGDSEKTVEDIEHVQVTGQRLAPYFKKLMYKAEEDFYGLYNDLTDNDDFKITCHRKEIHNFTRLKKRVCEAGYISKSINEGNEAAFSSMLKRNQLNGNFSGTSNKFQEARIALKYREKQLEDLKEKLLASPELMEKYIALTEAKTKYEEAK
jgi:hypothetical protein